MTARPQIQPVSLEQSVPESRRRNAYRIANVLGTVGLILTWWFKQDHDPYVQLMYPLFAVQGIISAVLLANSRIRLRIVEWYTLVVFTVIVLSKFAYEIYAKLPHTVSSLELTESVYWLATTLVVMIYLVLETRQGLYAALALAGALTLIGLPQLLGEAFAGETSRLFGFGRFLTFMAGLIPFLYVLSSVKERLAVERWLSHTDTLTGTANRRKLLDVLETVRLEQRSCAVILFDLDHFKSINDSHGHEVGDQVLSQVAACCAEALRARATDTIGRWGGEEFLVVLPNVTLDQAHEVAERLRSAVASHPFGDVGQVTASFGVAWSNEPDGLLELIRQADEAMYQSKRAGRNRIQSAALACPVLV